jgi:hypothetical protein
MTRLLCAVPFLPFTFQSCFLVGPLCQCFSAPPRPRSCAPVRRGQAQARVVARNSRLMPAARSEGAVDSKNIWLAVVVASVRREHVSVLVHRAMGMR